MNLVPRPTEKVPRNIPAYESDVHKLIDDFVVQAQNGASLSLGAFKEIWQSRGFSYIHQAVPQNIAIWDFVQLLYSVALNRLVDPSPYLQLEHEQQQQAGKPGQRKRQNGRVAGSAGLAAQQGYHRGGAPAGAAPAPGAAHPAAGQHLSRTPQVPGAAAAAVPAPHAAGGGVELLDHDHQELLSQLDELMAHHLGAEHEGHPLGAHGQLPEQQHPGDPQHYHHHPQYLQLQQQHPQGGPFPQYHDVSQAGGPAHPHGDTAAPADSHADLMHDMLGLPPSPTHSLHEQLTLQPASQLGALPQHPPYTCPTQPGTQPQCHLADAGVGGADAGVGGGAGLLLSAPPMFDMAEEDDYDAPAGAQGAAGSGLGAGAACTGPGGQGVTQAEVRDVPPAAVPVAQHGGEAAQQAPGGGGEDLAGQPCSAGTEERGAGASAGGPPLVGQWAAHELAAEHAPQVLQQQQEQQQPEHAEGQGGPAAQAMAPCVLRDLLGMSPSRSLMPSSQHLAMGTPLGGGGTPTSRARGQLPGLEPGAAPLQPLPLLPPAPPLPALPAGGVAAASAPDALLFHSQPGGLVATEHLSLPEPAASLPPPPPQPPAAVDGNLGAELPLLLEQHAAQLGLAAGTAQQCGGGMVPSSTEHQPANGPATDTAAGLPFSTVLPLGPCPPSSQAALGSGAHPGTFDALLDGNAAGVAVAAAAAGPSGTGWAVGAEPHGQGGGQVGAAAPAVPHPLSLQPAPPGALALAAVPPELSMQMALAAAAVATAAGAPTSTATALVLQQQMASGVACGGLVPADGSMQLGAPAWQHLLAGTQPHAGGACAIPPAQLPAPVLPAPGPDVPLSARVGALFAVYCLYGTQLSRPRVRVYVPLPLLGSLAALVEEAAELGLADVVSVVKYLWTQGALVPGGVARLPGATTPKLPTAPKHLLVPSANPSRAVTSPLFNETLMANPVLRQSLLHLRTALPGLTDYGGLARLCDTYQRQRAAIFAPPRQQQQQRIQLHGGPRGPPGGSGGGGGGAGLEQGDGGSGAAGQGAQDEGVEVLFNVGVGRGVKQVVDTLFAEVLEALRLPPLHVQRKQEERRQQQERQRQEEEAQRAAAAAAAAPRRPQTIAEALAAVAVRPAAEAPGRRVAGELGALMRRRGGAAEPAAAAAQQPARAPVAPRQVVIRHRTELAAAGLLGEADRPDHGLPRAVLPGVPPRLLEREMERRKRVQSVAETWLSMHDELLRSERQAGTAVGRRGAGEVAAAGAEGGAPPAAADAAGAAAAGVEDTPAAGTQGPRGRGRGRGGRGRQPGRGRGREAATRGGRAAAGPAALGSGDASGSGAMGGGSGPAHPAAAAQLEEAQEGGAGEEPRAGRGRGRGRRARGRGAGRAAEGAGGRGRGSASPQAPGSPEDASPRRMSADGRDDPGPAAGAGGGGVAAAAAEARLLADVHPVLHVQCNGVAGVLDTRARTVRCGCDACAADAGSSGCGSGGGGGGGAQQLPVAEWPQHCGIEGGRSWLALVHTSGPAPPGDSSAGGPGDGDASAGAASVSAFMRRSRLLLNPPAKRRAGAGAGAAAARALQEGSGEQGAAGAAASPGEDVGEAVGAGAAAVTLPLSERQGRAAVGTAARGAAQAVAAVQDAATSDGGNAVGAACGSPGASSSGEEDLSDDDAEQMRELRAVLRQQRQVLQAVHGNMQQDSQPAAGAAGSGVAAAPPADASGNGVLPVAAPAAAAKTRGRAQVQRGGEEQGGSGPHSHVEAPEGEPGPGPAPKRQKVSAAGAGAGKGAASGSAKRRRPAAAEAAEAAEGLPAEQLMQAVAPAARKRPARAAAQGQAQADDQVAAAPADDAPTGAGCAAGSGSQGGVVPAGRPRAPRKQAAAPKPRQRPPRAPAPRSGEVVHTAAGAQAGGAPAAAGPAVANGAPGAAAAAGTAPTAPAGPRAPAVGGTGAEGAGVDDQDEDLSVFDAMFAAVQSVKGLASKD